MKKLLLLLALLALILPLSACQPKTQATGGTDDSVERSAFLNQFVYFDFDKYNIRGDQISIVQAKANYLSKNTLRSTLYGYCDERGTDAYNITLGDRRAKAVLNYLVDLGISSSRLSAISEGENNP
ncbi:MAG: OmpA family protein, partial [Deltaproteobacteria bacterium]|nr:OmpA family protein [Deltaproteobacteria bacterium]